MVRGRESREECSGDGLECPYQCSCLLRQVSFVACHILPFRACWFTATTAPTTSLERQVCEWTSSPFTIRSGTTLYAHMAHVHMYAHTQTRAHMYTLFLSTPLRVTPVPFLLWTRRQSSSNSFSHSSPTLRTCHSTTSKPQSLIIQCTAIPHSCGPSPCSEADPKSGWSTPEEWRADARYAAMVVKVTVYYTHSLCTHTNTINSALHERWLHVLA